MADTNDVNIDRGSKIVAKEGVILREEADKWGLLYDPEKDFNFVINPVSVFIWKRLNGNFTVDEIVDGVKKNFESVTAEVEADVIEFIDALVKSKMGIIVTS